MSKEEFLKSKKKKDEKEKPKVLLSNIYFFA